MSETKLSESAVAEALRGDAALIERQAAVIAAVAFAKEKKDG